MGGVAGLAFAFGRRVMSYDDTLGRVIVAFETQGRSTGDQAQGAVGSRFVTGGAVVIGHGGVLNRMQQPLLI